MPRVRDSILSSQRRSVLSHLFVFWLWLSSGAFHAIVCLLPVPSRIPRACGHVVK
jgi:hypothetical protein